MFNNQPTKRKDRRMKASALSKQSNMMNYDDINICVLHTLNSAVQCSLQTLINCKGLKTLYALLIYKFTSYKICRGGASIKSSFVF